MRFRITLAAGLTLGFVTFLSTMGCDAQPSAPPVANPGEDHDHDRATDAHDHDHAEEHDHDHDHDHEHAEDGHASPETLAAAVTRLGTLHAAVEKAATGGDLSKADHEVHEIGHLLESIGKLAEKDAISDTAKAEIKAATEDLMDAYEQVDAKIHGEEGKAYADVAEKIAAAMKVLKAHEGEETQH